MTSKQNILRQRIHCTYLDMTTSIHHYVAHKNLVVNLHCLKNMGFKSFTTLGPDYNSGVMVSVFKPIEC
jgi:hypothetical protein